MKKINQLSKEAIQKGIFKYLIYQDPSFENVSIENLLSNEVWRSVKNVESRRQKDIERILFFLSQLDASHHELHYFISDHLENMGTGLFGRSKLREFIYEELHKLNPIVLDRDNLNFLQSIVNADPEGKIPALLARIRQLEEALETAEMLHQSDQEQIKYLRLQIVSLQTTMRETQADLSSALQVIEQERQSHQQSQAVIHNLLDLLQAKGILNQEDMTLMNPSDDIKKLPSSSPIPVPGQRPTGIEFSSTLDSTRSLMSVCSTVTQSSANFVRQNEEKKPYSPRM
jgi:hypothetical protein